MYSKVSSISERLEAGNRQKALFLKFALSLSFAVLTGLSSQIKLFLPVTPVPVTPQTMVVLLSGICLGPVFGALSQIMYLFWGMQGMPWFTGGFLSFSMPTFGYVIGFIPAAAIAGWFSERTFVFSSGIRSFISLLVALLPVYLFGFLYFAILSGGNFAFAFNMSVRPFILVALAKIGLLAACLPFLMKKRFSYT